MLSSVLIWTVFGVWNARWVWCALNTKSMKGKSKSSLTSVRVQSLRTSTALSYDGGSIQRSSALVNQCGNARFTKPALPAVQFATHRPDPLINDEIGTREPVR